MKQYIEREATNADVSENTKIKTHFANVIVERFHGDLYYNILYFDPTDKEYHIGFGSYYLGYVFKWLEEEFEITEQPAAEMVEVKRGRWEYKVETVDSHEEGWFSCSLCGYEFWNMENFCPNCGADMREET